MNCLLLGLLPFLGAAAEPPPSADPWVYRDGDSYLYLRTTGRDIRVARAERLADIGTAPAKVVWRPPADGPYAKELWAPELHRLDGQWYIYFAADDGENRHHRMWVLQADGPDPQGGYHFVGQVTTADNHWAIDGTVFEWAGRRYFCWSGWAGDKDGRQDLYLAAMNSPTTLTGERVRIAQPRYAWERHGLAINEGPEALIHGGRLRLIFSASAFWQTEYCLGMLTLKEGGDTLDPQAWEKHPQPVFQASATVKGPGHCSFATTPDGQDWLVYHAHGPEGGHRRVLRMQTFGWGATGEPEFGVPR